jgi:hypothetical protein
VKGNPKDSGLFQDTIEAVKKGYGKPPDSRAADGGYAGSSNMKYAHEEGIVSIVFNKIAGIVKNVCPGKREENLLKKRRAGIEGVISNLERDIEVGRCTWKGWKHYRQKVYRSIIGYNVRVMTAAVIAAAL